jgi:hypothetical protein
VQEEGAALAAGVQAWGQGVEETHGRLQGFRRCRGRAGAGRRRSWWPAAAPVRECEGRRRAGTRGKSRAGYVGSRDATQTVLGRFYMGTGARVQGEGGVQKKQTGAGVRLADFYRAQGKRDRRAAPGLDRAWLVGVRGRGFSEQGTDARLRDSVMGRNLIG